MSKGQPLISQYLAIKEANKDAVVFFQVGTFYQLYYYDAELAASILHTKIISRAIGGGQKIPMCGIPKTAGRKRAETFAREGVIRQAKRQKKGLQCGSLQRRLCRSPQPDHRICLQSGMNI